MKLIVGLGNPGPQFTHTRHNLGFMVINQLAEQLHADPWTTESKFKSLVSRAGDIILAKPQTMMNLSGEAVQQLVHFYKIDPGSLWVAFDDVDTPFGRLRLRNNGGTGSGHQGVNSIIRHVGPTFVRAKLGISLNNRQAEPSEVYVLQPFNSEERHQLPTVIEHGADILAEQITFDAPAETTFDLL